MHSFLDSKAMAKALRAALAERGIEITHSDSLELVARQFGLDNWNVLAALIARTAADRPPLPPGWYRTGTADPHTHRMGQEPDASDMLLIESLSADAADAFGSLAQTILADDYRGSKVSFSAELSGGHCDKAAIWMRVDSAEKGKWLRFDNLIDRASPGPLTGSFGWTERTIVLEVPDAATRILCGVMLIGVGTLRARNIEFGVADRDAVPTDYPRRPDGLGDGAFA